MDQISNYANLVKDIRGHFKFLDKVELDWKDLNCGKFNIQQEQWEAN